MNKYIIDECDPCYHLLQMEIMALQGPQGPPGLTIGGSLDPRIFGTGRRSKRRNWISRSNWTTGKYWISGSNRTPGKYWISGSNWTASGSSPGSYNPPLIFCGVALY